MNEVIMFPLRNERGFRVLGEDDYIHMINTIINAQVELAEDYPEKDIIVVYLTELAE